MHHRTAFLVSLLAGGLSAQQEPPKPPSQQPPAEQRLDQQAERMRQQINEGGTVRTHVRVMVRLKNGNRLQGVVKDSEVIVRNGTFEFVRPAANDPRAASAGIRLWYYNTSNSFVFVPFDNITEYRVQERLNTAQLVAMEEELRAVQRREAERRELELLAQQKAAAGAAGEGAEAGSEAAVDGEPVVTSGPVVLPTPGTVATPKPADKPKSDAPADDSALLALLQEFPPADGWSAERKAEIVRKKVAVGAAPSEQEKRFLEVFDDWQKAVTRFLGSPKPAGETQTGSGTGGRRKK